MSNTSKSPKLPQYLSIIARVLSDYDGVIEEGVTACTSLTNTLLLLGGGGEEELYQFLALPDPSSTPTSSPTEPQKQQTEAPDYSPILTAYLALQESFQTLTAWYTSLLDATFSLQTAVDGTSNPPDALPIALREKCFELLGDLRAMYALEYSVRGGILSGLLPGRYHKDWAQLNPGVISALVPLTPAFEGNRDALTLAVAAWAVSGHAEKTRVKSILSALEVVVGQ